MATWKTREGVTIPVRDMELSHVRNTLKMLIAQYTVEYLRLGARYTSGIDVESMNEYDLRDMMTKTCEDRGYLKTMVLQGCFRYTSEGE